MTDPSPILDECIHGLTAAWCSICKSVPKSQRTRTPSLSHPTFSALATSPVEPGPPSTLAKFDSPCPWCGYTIEEEVDRVYLRDGDWVDAECAAGYDQHHGGSR